MTAREPPVSAQVAWNEARNILARLPERLRTETVNGDSRLFTNHYTDGLGRPMGAITFRAQLDELGLRQISPEAFERIRERISIFNLKNLRSPYAYNLKLNERALNEKGLFELKFAFKLAASEKRGASGERLAPELLPRVQGEKTVSRALLDAETAARHFEIASHFPHEIREMRNATEAFAKIALALRGKTK